MPADVQDPLSAGPSNGANPGDETDSNANQGPHAQGTATSEPGRWLSCVPIPWLLVFCKSFMSWFILIRYATFQNVILAKMSSEIHIPAAILSLDLEKAFDRVEWRVCLLPLKRWALALPSLGGSVFFILRRGVRFLLMATHLLFFILPVVWDRDFLCRLFFMCLLWRFYL